MSVITTVRFRLWHTGFKITKWREKHPYWCFFSIMAAWVVFMWWIGTLYGPVIEHVHLGILIWFVYLVFELVITYHSTRWLIRKLGVFR